MTVIRINMVINKDEHPELYDLLVKKPAKVRASIIRNYVEFALWKKLLNEQKDGHDPIEGQSTIQSKDESDCTTERSKPTNANITKRARINFHDANLEKHAISFADLRLLSNINVVN